jgi:addiction module HigA family antidote
MASKPLEMGMPPVHPGEFIRTEILDELGLSIAKAARVLGVRAATLSDLVNEKSALSPEMAMRIELAFGVKVDLLMRMQALYDSTTIRSRAAELNVQRYQPENA